MLAEVRNTQRQRKCVSPDGQGLAFSTPPQHRKEDGGHSREHVSRRRQGTFLPAATFKRVPKGALPNHGLYQDLREEEEEEEEDSSDGWATGGDSTYHLLLSGPSQLPELMILASPSYPGAASQSSPEPRGSLLPAASSLAP